jgi:hypothetical protein
MRGNKRSLMAGVLVMLLQAPAWVHAAKVTLDVQANGDIRGGYPSASFSRELLAVSNDDGSVKGAAKAYLRFQLPADFGTATAATFKICRGDAVSIYDLRYEIFGLNDAVPSETSWGQADTFSPAVGDLTWNNSPGNNTNSASDFVHAANVGSFTAAGSKNGGSAGDSDTVSGTPLVNFINSDTNGYVTLMISQDARDVTSSENEFASRANKKFGHPLLELTYTPAKHAAIDATEDQRLQKVASQRWHDWISRRHTFPIAAWAFFPRYPGTLEEYQTYAGAGLNLVQAPQDQVAHATAAGLDVMLGSWENLWENREKLAASVNFSTPNTRVAGYILQDEPPPTQFPQLGDATKYIYEHDQRNALPLIDVFPEWTVMYERFGMSYETYMRKFIDEIHPAVLLNCHYTDVTDGTTVTDRRTYYYNMELFRRLALQADIGLMGFVRVSTFDVDYSPVSLSDVRRTCNSYLAYGAKGIWYYFYRVGDAGYENGIVDHEHGKPTKNYGIVQTINREVQAIGPILLGLRSVAVEHTGPVLPLGVHRYYDGDLPGIKHFTGDQFILGAFESEKTTSSGDRYLMIVNKRHGVDENDTTLKATAEFSATDEFPLVYRYDPQTGQPVRLTPKDGVYSVQLGGGCCALIRLAHQPISATADATH